MFKGLVFVAIFFGAISAWAQNNSALLRDQWYVDYKVNSYVVSLPLTRKNMDGLESRRSFLRFYQVYLSNQSLGQIPEIHIGFFADEEKARQTIDTFKHHFVDMRPLRISETFHQKAIEGDTSIALLLNGDENKASASVDTLFEHAKHAYIKKDFIQAENIYRLLLLWSTPDKAAWAHELLALSQTRNGEWKRAIKSYEHWLVLYPKNPSKPRIEQRLLSLRTAPELKHAPLRRTRSDGNGRLFSRGVLGQYYRVAERKVGDMQSEKTLELLSTDWDFRSGGEWGDHNARVRLSGFALQDQLNDESEQQVRRAFIDYQHNRYGIGAKIGRQKDSDTGVFTRFDGVSVSHQFQKHFEAAVTVGEPVYNSDTLSNLDQSFTSFKLAWDDGESWQFNGYWVSQTLENVTDREAIGLRGSFHKDRFSSTLLLDYDTVFSELNNLLLNAHWSFSHSGHISAVVGRQHSPLLTASNILIGQSDLDLGVYLRNRENLDSLIDDAQLRTGLNDYFSLSGQTPLSDGVSLSVDYYHSQLSNIPNFEVLAGLPDSGVHADEFTYDSVGVRLLFDKLFGDQNYTTLGGRQSSNSNSRTVQIYSSLRFRFKSVFFINPKVTLFQTKFNNRDQEQKQFRSSINLIYRPYRNLEINAELGSESLDQGAGAPSFDTRYYFLGYRWNF